MGVIRGFLIVLLGLGLGAATATEAADGVQEGFIVVGQSAPLSGPLAEQGREYRRGAALYFDAVNARGGVHGRNLFLLTLDDASEAERAAENTRRLIERDRVFALFGYVGAAAAQAALPLVGQARVPFFAPQTGTTALRTPMNRYVFNVRASIVDEAEALATRLAAQQVAAVAVLYQEDALGRSGLDALQPAMARHNIQIKATAGVAAGGVEVEGAVKAIVAAEPEAVLLAAGHGPAALFIRKAREAGLDVDFLALSLVGSKALATQLWTEGLGVAVAQVAPFPGDESVPVVAEFLQTLRSFSTQPEVSFASLEGFIAAKAFVTALERAGRDLDREQLIEAGEGMEGVDLGGLTLNWGPTSHAGSTYVAVTVIGETRRWLY